MRMHARAGRSVEMASSIPDSYPVRFDVDYPESLNRLTTLLRLIWLIPIAILYGLLAGGGTVGWEDEGTRSSSAAAAGGLIILPTMLMLLFRQKYPRWWFDFNLELSRFGARVGTYALLLRDEYPSTDEEQAIHLDIDYPDATQLNRFLPLVKWLLAFPHYIVLLFLGLGALLAVIVAWFAILFTGTYPRQLFDYVVGVQRWGNRVAGYAFLMVTDRYPPFSLR
jgi:Domain of unknown function (DUF4389)